MAFHCGKDTGTHWSELSWGPPLSLALITRGMRLSSTHTSLSHKKACTKHLDNFIHQKTDSKSKTIIHQPIEWKQQSEVVRKTKSKTTEEYVPDEGTRENRRERAMWHGDRQPLEKEFGIMIAKMIQDLGKGMEARMKVQEMFNKDLEELKNKQGWIIQYLKWQLY